MNARKDKKWIQRIEGPSFDVCVSRKSGLSAVKEVVRTGSFRFDCIHNPEKGKVAFLILSLPFGPCRHLSSWFKDLER